MGLNEWVDVPAVAAVCRHVSTFALGLLIAAGGKPAIALAVWIGCKVQEPFAAWLISGLSLLDDALIAYFALCLAYRLGKELWPLGGVHHILVVA